MGPGDGCERQDQTRQRPQAVGCSIPANLQGQGRSPACSLLPPAQSSCTAAASTDPCLGAEASQPVGGPRGRAWNSRGASDWPLGSQGESAASSFGPESGSSAWLLMKPPRGGVFVWPMAGSSHEDTKGQGTVRSRPQVHSRQGTPPSQQRTGMQSSCPCMGRAWGNTSQGTAQPSGPTGRECRAPLTWTGQQQPASSSQANPSLPQA